MAAPYYGWYFVAACATIAYFSWGFAFYGLGVYLHVLVRLHGWPTGTISVVVTAYYLIGAGLIIAVGRLIDRHGPTGVLAYGVCAMAGALALLGQITALWQLFAVYVLLATGWACLSYAGSLVVGLAVGNMITLPPILTREEFGSHAFGTIFGMVSAASQAGLAFGPALIGRIRDTRGSYQPALWALVALEVLAIAGVLWGRALRGPRLPLPAG